MLQMIHNGLKIAKIGQLLFVLAQSIQNLKVKEEKKTEVEKESGHRGYYYKISDILTIIICGMLCNLQNISDIYEWAKAEPVRQFLFREFGIRKLPSKAQFYNLIKCINPKKFTAKKSTEKVH